MPTAKITKTSVDALTANGRAVLLWDPELKGFGVKAEASGAKSYVVQYRLGGRGTKVRRYTIGRHGSPWTPTTARTEAERLLRLVRQGIDVLQAKQEKSRNAHDLAFDAYVERFIDDCLKERWVASWTDGKSLLKGHAVPVLKSKPLPEITRADIRAVLDHAKGKVATRRNIFAVLRRLFRWAISQGDLDRSPLEGMEPPPLPQSRDRVLADWELRLVFLAAAKEEGPFAPLVRMLIITGQRLKELAGARWDELDRDLALLRIPAVRAKNRRATDVPLSQTVIEDLDSLAGGKKWPAKGLVFSTTGKTPVSGFARTKRRLDRHMEEIAAEEREERPIPPWRYHDLRRTFATGMQRIGVRFEVTEALLNHVGSSRSGVAGVYQRHDWKTEKQAALEAWSSWIADLTDTVSTTNVLQFRRTDVVSG
jgi:integrase